MSIQTEAPVDTGSPVLAATAVFGAFLRTSPISNRLGSGPHMAVDARASKAAIEIAPPPVRVWKANSGGSAFAALENDSF